MGHGSGHGLAPGLAHGSFSFDDDEDNSPAEEVSPVKPKKPSKRAAKTKKDIQRRAKRPQKSGQWRKRLRCAKEADEVVQETQEFRPMGRDRAKAKKKAVCSSSGGSSSFVNLVADKFYNIKQKKGKEGQGTTVLYRLEEFGVEYPGGRGSRNCTAEKGETRNSASNA
uniref:Uncharacterized protein n=1 Tax=Tanacetum cinerariifolium TaxID=118510 RepID=A0A6L2MQA6_TANCI|nr:hypothetical protein [Tanacetum cinerariifolium]